MKGCFEVGKSGFSILSVKQYNKFISKYLEVEIIFGNIKVKIEKQKNCELLRKEK